MAGDDRKVKHLEMIQGVINRLSTNSFLLKGWSVTLVAALTALAAGSEHHETLVLLAYFPAFMLWILDGFFLAQERAYRRLFDSVRKLSDDAPVEFSMDASPHRTDDATWIKALFSRTLFAFYVVLIISVYAVMAIGLNGRK